MRQPYKREQFRGKDARDIRDQMGLGFEQIANLAFATKLLDDIDCATSIEDLRRVMRRLVSRQFGVE